MHVALYQVERLAAHETATLHAVASRLAKLKGLTFDPDKKIDPAEQTYLLPTGTLCDPEEARRLGITTEADFFGGLVPRPFAGTKAITHGLVVPDAVAPADWLPAFPDAVKDVALAGFTAFSRRDAAVAGEHLLQSGPVRLKPVLARGGTGQIVATTRAQLQAALETVAEHEIRDCGLVLEENLTDIETYSVGQLRLGDIMMTYCGTQHMTTDNRGALVYGGSDLIVARGGYEALLSVRLPAPVLKAIEQARVYDEAADLHIPGFLASRRNYDVAHGRQADGTERYGVLEQSWRVGGASPAEVLALEAYRADPGVTFVRAASVETYGTGSQPPDDAEIFYQGDDSATGPLLKFATVHPL